MRVAALIPARSGSERIPGKNIKKLNGLPLVAWTVATALACPSITEVYVSSDSSIILEVGEKYGAEGLSRPRSLAGPKVQDFPVVKHCLQVVPGLELIVYLRPTTPLRSVHQVEQAIKLMLESSETATGLRSVHRMPESAFKCFTISYSLLQPVTYLGFDQTDKPDQEVEPTYKPNGYVDVILPATVLEKESCFGDTVIPFVTQPVIELDTPDDWDYLEYILKTKGAGDTHEFYREGGALNPTFGI